MQHLSRSKLVLCVVSLSAWAGCAADDSDLPEPHENDEQANIFVPECTPSSCNNGGTCAETLLGFECACVAGFTGAACEVAPSIMPPPVFPDLLPHQLTINVQQTFDAITEAPGKVSSVTVSMNGQTCAGGACSALVLPGTSTTVQVRLDFVSDLSFKRPVLRGWDGCATSGSTFDYVVAENDSSSATWTYTFASLSSDKNCTANFAQAATVWFHLPPDGPSDAIAAPSGFCDHTVRPLHAAQLPPGVESWSTICFLPPGQDLTLTPLYQGRQLNELTCLWKERLSTEFTRLRFTSTPAILPNVQAGIMYECGLERLP